MLNFLSSIGHAVVQANFVGLSVASKIVFKSSENFLVLLLFAKRNLLDIGKVITDMPWLIAFSLDALKISHLHPLHCWRDIIGELSHGIDGLLPKGLAGDVGVIDGLQVLGILVEEVRDHGLCGMLWKIEATFRHFLIYI